jgi:hypothetical protein
MRIGTAMGITSRRRQKLGATLAAVTGLVVTTIDHNHAVLDWTDAASAPSGYRVYRQELDQSGNAVGSEILLGTVAQSVETYDDTFDVNILFEDDFSLGNFTKTMNGISWVSQTFVDIVTAAAIGAGNFARYREGDSGGLAELRYDGLPNLPEVFLERGRYFPIGTESPSVGPKMLCLGALNDKDWRLWGHGNAGYDGYPNTGRIAMSVASGNKFVRASGSFITDGFANGQKVACYGFSGNADQLVSITNVTALQITVSETLTVEASGSNKQLLGYNNKVGGSTRGDSGHQDGQAYAEFCFSNPAPGNPQYPMGEVLGDGGSTFFSGTQTHVDLITDAYRGRLFVDRMRVKQASTANNDGVIQVWIDGVQKLDFQGLSNGDIYSLTAPGYTTGYLRGAANNGWPAGQYEYLKYFRISTGGFVG